MNYFKTYIKEHHAVFWVVFVLWLFGVFLGTYTALSFNSSAALDIGKYIDASVNGQKTFGGIFINGLVTNLRYALLLCLSSTFVLLFPLAGFLVALKGFAIGFSASFIIRLYGLTGVAVTITSVVLPLIFSLPVYFIMFMSSLQLPIQIFVRRKQLLTCEKWNIHTAHMAKMLIFFAFLCLITVAEAFLSPHFFGVLINKG